MIDPIPASTPTVLPAVPERVYDLWRIEESQITRGPAGELIGQVRFRKFRVLADGTSEVGPSEAILGETNLDAIAAEDPEFAAAMEAYTRAAVKRALAQGLL